MEVELDKDLRKQGFGSLRLIFCFMYAVFPLVMSVLMFGKIADNRARDCGSMMPLF